jgi:DNA-binding NarL/FixJ family response regulator
MPILSGFDAAREIKIKSPRCAIVILSSSVDQRFVDEARKIAICAYVAKTKAGEALVRAVEAAVQGEDCGELAADPHDVITQFPHGRQ